jgi:hypothetical protein
LLLHRPFMDRSIEFYSKALWFEKVSDVEITGTEFEHLEGIFGMRMRVVRMRLGDQFIELIEYLAPRGRPMAVDSRSKRRVRQRYTKNGASITK